MMGSGVTGMAASYQPPHPGSLVKAEMESLGFSINAFARKLDVSPATIHRLVTEKSAISPEMAIRLSMTIGQSARLWMQRQAEYDLWHVRQNGHVGKLPDLRA